MAGTQGSDRLSLRSESVIEKAMMSEASGVLPGAEPAPPVWPRIRRWGLKLGEFLLAQGVLQILMAVGGFMLLRWMPVEEYARFTLAFAIQSAMIAIADIGFSGAIVPLVGRRTGEPATIGAYIAGARRLRQWLLPFVMVGGFLAFLLLGRRQGVEFAHLAVLFLLVAATVWTNAVSVLNCAPLVIRQDLRFLQVIQNGMAVLRIGGYTLGHVAGILGSVLALGLNTLLNGGLAGLLRRRARPHVDEPDGNAPSAVAARAEILRFVRPQVPLVIFNAVQGQIIIFLASIFGQGGSLAETGALTRLNLIFAVAPYLLGWVVQPYFARIESRLVVRRFWQITGAGFLTLACAPLAGWVLPEPFLWLLGPSYSHLRTEVALLLLGGSLGAAVGLVSTLLLARRWVFADAIVWIGLLTVGFQVLAVAFGDVSRPSGALGVMIWGNFGSLIAYLILAIRGQRNEGDQVKLVG